MEDEETAGASPAAEHRTDKGLEHLKILGSGKARSAVRVDRPENWREIAMCKSPNEVGAR